MKSSLRTSIDRILFTCLCVLSLPAAAMAEPPSFRYLCSFQMPMTSVYPVSLYDTSSDGMYHIENDLQVSSPNGGRRYVSTITKTWPILGNNVLAQTFKGRLSEVKKVYRIGSLRLAKPLKRIMPATYYVYSSELYIGGACASCRMRIRGECRRVSLARANNLADRESILFPK